MNTKSLLALATLALVAATGARAGTLSHWTPDASPDQAFPSLARDHAPGKTRAEVQAEARGTQAVHGLQWTADAAAADAFPALRAVPAGSGMPMAAPMRAPGRIAAMPLSEREGA